MTPNNEQENEQENTYPRRDLLKKVAYTAPLIVTLAVKPVARSGSGNQDGNSQG
jgi:hypothetical protein